MVATLESFNWMLFLETANPKNFSNCINSHWRDGITSPETSSCENKFQSAKCLNIHIRTLRTYKWSTALYGPIDHDLNSNWGREEKGVAFWVCDRWMKKIVLLAVGKKICFSNFEHFQGCEIPSSNEKHFSTWLKHLLGKIVLNSYSTFSINIHCLLYITWRGSSNSKLQKSRYGKALDKHFSSQVWWLMFYMYSHKQPSSSYSQWVGRVI